MEFFAEISRSDLASFEERVDNVEIGLAEFKRNEVTQLSNGTVVNKAAFESVSPGHMVQRANFVVKTSLPAGKTAVWTGQVFINGMTLEVAMFRTPRTLVATPTTHPSTPTAVPATVVATTVATATSPAASRLRSEIKIGNNAMQRHIHLDAINLLDMLLQNNALARDCIAKKRVRQLFVEAAKACLGIKEISKNKGPEVELFQKTVGLSVGDAWCMAFMQTCLAYAEHKTNIKSPLHASGGCVNVWQKSPVEQRVKVIPLAGAIAIWQHLDDPTHGHTGLVLDCDGVSFHAIEGNTSDGFEDINGEVGQTGDGVGFTHRRYDLFNPQRGDMQLKGCLKPF